MLTTEEPDPPAEDQSEETAAAILELAEKMQRPTGFEFDFPKSDGTTIRIVGRYTYD